MFPHRPLFTPVTLVGVLLIASCNAQTPSKGSTGNATSTIPASIQIDTTQLSAYIVAAFEDSKGNLWFGTVGDGVIRYEPKPLIMPAERLTYFTMADGLADMVSCSIVEDKQGNIWIGSHDGATRYDGTTFTAFKTPEGLHGAGCVLLVDRNGTLWAGTNDGAFRYDGARFQPFEIPIPTIKEPSHKWVRGKVWEIIEDSKGNIWFGRDGYGATRYDPSTPLSASGNGFTHFTKEDGLCSNNVASIAEDADGNLWFGCITSDFPPIQEGGVVRYDGKSFTRFADVKGLTANDVYTVYAMRSGHVWIGAVGVGAYRYTPPSLLRSDRMPFTLFDETERPHLIQNFGVQAVLEDSKGTLWFGFSGGLFRFNGTIFENVTRGGPWMLE
ncbi:MAG: two-component regulator propeller domain-containing protein [Flavobacteriales bacterium]